MSELVMISQKDEISTMPIEDLNLSRVKNLVHKNCHPNPIIVGIICVVIFIFIYYIYVIFWKQCFNGRWINTNGTSMYVKHNKWSDHIVVDGHMHGYSRGKAIYIKTGNKTSVGALYDNSIYWFSGEIWTRPLEL